MQSLVANKGGLPTQFNPENTHDKQSQADAIIAYAKRIKDWPLLEQAIDAKIEEQIEFVRWWDERVTAGRNAQLKNSVVTDTVTTIAIEEAEKLTGFSKMQVSRIRKRLQDVEKYRDLVKGAAYKNAFPEMSGNVTATAHTGDEESYTPVVYLESARQVMGGIDLDPASNPMAQKNVQASEYFTAADDGLEQDWRGRVWLNPPYTALVINKFVDKLVNHYIKDDISQAILLTNNNTDTSWFHIAARHSNAICFTRGRINFLKRDGSTSSPTNGQAFFYFGDNAEGFTKTFTAHGLVMVRA